MRRSFAVLLVSVLTASMTLVGGDARAASCAPGGEDAADWPSFGRDLSNTRHQQHETQIGPDNVADLQPAWALSAFANGGTGGFQSTPAVADGCVFVGTSTGAVFAADAGSGEVVWQTSFASVPAAGGIFGVSVADGRVHVLVGQLFFPYAVALDQQTGETLWVTPLLDQHIGFVNSSAVVHDGLFFIGTGGRDVLDPFTRPPFYILDAETGEILKKTRAIPDGEAFEGVSPYGGGGIWTTAVVDTETGYLYAGTANPYSKKLEHERTNSILKIDFDRTRPTFGEVVDNYKGDFDYIPERYDSAECQTLGDAQPVGYGIFCGQQDVDFGASPNLFESSSGELIVGALQKSGAYHAVNATTMEGVWKTQLADPSLGGNSASSAFDETSIYVPTNAGLYALDRETGQVRWHSEEGGAGYQPVTVANGVVYGLSGTGALLAFDADTGQLLSEHSLSGFGASCTGTSAAGVAVAYNTVYASCDSGDDRSGAVFAYRL